MKKFMIYGATGYTGKLIARTAHVSGMRPVLGGRNRKKLQDLAGSLGLEFRAVKLDQPHALDAALCDIDAVLHVAGPYGTTLEPMVEACLRTGTHYIDLSGDIDDYEKLILKDDEARRKGIMLMPAAGFDVVPTDCLASYVAAKVPGATKLTTFISGFSHFSRGTRKTGIETFGRGLRMRKEGRITGIDCINPRMADFGKGEVPCLPMTWGDAVISYYSTGIPTIMTYHEASLAIKHGVYSNHYCGKLFGSAWMKSFMLKMTDLLAEGPSDMYRNRAASVFIARAEDDRGGYASARLFAPEGYTLTASISLEIIRKILSGTYESGFQTPSGLFGPDFILELDGVRREDTGVTTIPESD